MSNIQVTLSNKKSVNGLRYQQLDIQMVTKDRIVEPADLVDLELPVGIDNTMGVVISGRAPIWLYAYFVHELHPTNWVACFDPRLSGGIVVATHSHLVNIGEIIIEAKVTEDQLCPALMIVGPPNSGKSVLSHVLSQTLILENPNIFLQRANWDGEGNWTLEISDTEQVEKLRTSFKGKLTEEFYPKNANWILALRSQMSLVIVDVGGMVQPEKIPVLEACSDYLIISSKPEEIENWHEFCRDRGNLNTVAVVHSTLNDSEEIIQQEPFLEMVSGAWQRGQHRTVSEDLLKRVRSLLLKRE